MFKVQARPTLKLKYFDCKKGGIHEGQVLNYVCIQKSCADKGLICSVCKNDHREHNVVPLKYLLSTLKDHKQNPAIESQCFQTQLQQLQQLKNSFLYELKSIVQKLSQKIQLIEQQIIQKFKKQKVELLNQIEIKMKFNEIIQQTLNNNLDDQQSFQKDFKIIASLIETKNNQENKSSGGNNSGIKSINNFYFSVNLNKIIAQYQNSYQSFNKKINKFYNDSVPILKSMVQDNPVLKQQPKKLQSSNPSNPTIITKDQPNIGKQYRFSQTSKGSNITLINDNKTADCTKAGNQRFALIDGLVAKKGSVIRFKVQKLKNWVGLGLAIKNIIEGKKYQFLYNNLGHGSFLLSNNSYMWSHAYAANNIQNSQFTFVQVTETELIYTNQSQQNKVKKLPLLLNEAEWKQACFCVNLCSIGDAATIL